VTAALRRRRRRERGPGEALPPERKWRAITFATLLLAPAVWSMLAGLVALADEGTEGPNPAAPLVFGLCLLPFVFVVLAFSSEHPNAPMAAAKAMGLCLLVGIMVSAAAADAATGLVAGVGAGGIVALRSDVDDAWKPRALGLLFACAYTFVLVRAAGAIVLLAAPVFPFTVLGVADHLAERRAARG
jgi:hypothetical protein